MKAQEDAQEALQPKNRTYKSAPLADYIKARDLDDYAKGAYTTNKYLDQTPEPDTLKFQRILNSFGIKDNFGNKLKEDGLYGPKTLQAAENLIKLQNNIKRHNLESDNKTKHGSVKNSFWKSNKGYFGTSLYNQEVPQTKSQLGEGNKNDDENKAEVITFYKNGTLWCNNNLQGFGILDNGEIVGTNLTPTDRSLLKLKFETEKYNTDQSKTNKTGQLSSYVKINDPLSSYTIKDVTQKINGLLASTEYMYKDYAKYGWINTLPTFYYQVKLDSEGDLKNNPAFSNSLYIYNNEIIDRDALGNIYFGYLGKVYGIPDEILYRGAGFAQILSGLNNTKWEWRPFYFDDPRDQQRIKQGIDIYYATHN